MEVQLNDKLMADVAMDVRRNLKRALGARALETKSELVNNVYPLFEQMLVAIDERFLRAEGAIDELLEDEGSRIEPELASAITRVFALGSALGELLVAAIPKADDLARKRYADAVAEYVAEATRVAGLVEEATLEPEEPEEDDEDAEDEDDDEGEDDEDEAAQQAGTEKEGA